MDTVDDTLLRFLLPAAGIRGIAVRLGASWRTLASHGAADSASAGLLGQACTAAALLGGHVKIEGRLSIQLRGGPITTLFAECTAAGTLRGIATLAEGVAADDPALSPDLGSLGAGSLLAITVENPGARGQDPHRYQGLVGLDAARLSAAFEAYFDRSEQLPTRLLLAADGQRAAGLMLQKLPGDAGDLDGWERASALFDTLGTAELLDTPVDLLLHRLFHEEGVGALGERPLRFACSCSRDRVSAMLESLGETESREAAAGHGGLVEVRCEFCGETYRFTGEDLDGLFAPRPTPATAPERLQ
mgnify:CR=1 FL=1